MSANTEQKIVNLAAITAVADQVGMSIPEFMEWGMHLLISTFSNSDHNPGALKDYLPSLHKIAGTIAPGVIRKTPLDTFIESEGLSEEEFNEAAILEAMAFVDSVSFESDDRSLKHDLERFREDRRLLLPEIGPESATSVDSKQKVHPFMHRLFSADLKAVHGETFGDFMSKEIHMEHRFLMSALENAFAQKTWDECIVELMLLESVVRHCPKLQNEAASIRATIDADKILNDFNHAVNAA